MVRQFLGISVFICLFSQTLWAESDSNVSAASHSVSPVKAELAEKLQDELKNLPVQGAYINHIELFEGIRAMDGEIASPGEIKVMLNFAWQDLPAHPPQRSAEDKLTADVVRLIFSQHPELSKLRIIIKTVNNRGKYQSSAKLFSFTRAAWELSQNLPGFQLDQQAGIEQLLALGDYIVLTNAGWKRGY